MHVQIAANILDFDQIRKPAFSRRFHLALVFTQYRRDKWQSQFFENFLFVDAGDGMVVRIDPPNYATRCEILRSITQRNGMCLNDEVVTWIARRVTQNVRELEGAVTRIAAHIKMSGRPADIAMATEAMVTTSELVR